MPYENDNAQQRRRLIPIGVSSALAAGLVASEIANDLEILLGAFVFIWLIVGLIQMAAVPWLTLLTLIADDYDYPLALRLPTLVVVSAMVGAVLFWAESPWKGAVCGMLMLAGWLMSIRDQL